MGNDPVNNADPTGMFLVAGALIGAGIELAVQIATGSDINVKDIAVAGAVGAVTGGFAGQFAKAAAIGSMSASKAISQTAKVAFSTGVAGSAAKSGLNGEAPSAKKMAIAGVANAAGSAVGAKLATAGAAQLESKIAQGGVAAHVAKTTQSAVFPEAAENSVAGSGELSQAGADFVANYAEASAAEKLDEQKNKSR